MKLDLDTDLTQQNHIRSYEPGIIVVNNTTMSSPFVILPDNNISNLPVQTASDLQFSDLSSIIEQKPELIIIGTGDSIVFPQKSMIAEVQRLNIGFEVMDTGAACRCFNLLLLEKRQVAAIMFI